MPRPDILVIGGGVIGCACARRLAKDGATVVLLDAGQPGSGASSAAAGLLYPHFAGGDPSRPDDAFLDLCLRSLDLYPELVRALAEETGIDVGFRTEGMLEVALAEEDQRLLDRKAQVLTAASVRVEPLSGDDARALEPAVAREVRSALLLPSFHRIGSRRLTAALALAARRAGARIEADSPVTGLLVEGGRVRGALTVAGRREAGAVVLAAGTGSRLLPVGGRGPLPVEPIRGQIACLMSDGTLLRRPVIAGTNYLVPREDGRVLAGTTMERAGYDARPTAGGIAQVLARAAELVPASSELPIREVWAGLRPATPDGRPVLGPDPELPGLIYATGHGGNGVLLAPVTADWVSRTVSGEEPPADPVPFRADRFPQARA